MNAHRYSSFLLLCGLGLASTGCGAISAVTNPGASWALGESPSMTVIVRRAELSRATVEQVDRFLEKPLVAEEGTSFELTEAQAKELLLAAAKDPAYAGQPVRVVPSEAWVAAMSGTCPAERGSSLVSMLGEEAELAYVEVATLGREQAALTAEIEALEDKADAEGASPADIASIDKAIAELEAKRSQLEASYEPKAAKLFKEIEKLAGAASSERKEAMAPVVLRLSEAIEDALQANSAAVIRYPLALPALTSDLQLAAQRFAADVLEEQTGRRPDTSGITPGITIDGTDLALTLNGIPEDELGDLDAAALISETSVRTKDYFGAALGLVGYASETQERLSFQDDLLEAWRAGLGDGVLGRHRVTDITDLEVVTKPQKPGEASGEEGATSHAGPAVRRSSGGLAIATCDAPPSAGEPSPVAAR